MKFKFSECPTCSSAKISIIKEFDKFPVTIFPVPKLVKDEVKFEKLSIYSCHECGHVFKNDVNITTNDEIYSKWYQYYPFSLLESMNTFYRLPFEEVFKRSLQNSTLTNPKILEIGGSENQQFEIFLKSGCEVTTVSPEVSKLTEVRCVKGYYGDTPVKGKYDYIIARFVLEHIYDLKKFFRHIKLNLKANGKIIFQVPNASKYIRQGITNIYVHEHIHYFSVKSLMELFNKYGFDVVQLYHSESSSLIFEIQLVENDTYISENSKLSVEIMSIINSSKKMVALYGAGLSLAGLIYDDALNDSLEKLLIVDDNPEVQGLYLPKSDIVVKSIDEMMNSDISDIILILNPIYHDSVSKRLTTLYANSQHPPVLHYL